ncbi:MAG: hypothetical protein HC803_06495 [Saprospiraceae bacterium]|nr:hypothetical protein [Saprospiraceae bacterium]
MLERKTTYQSEVFQDFERLGKRNYHEIIRFCERNRDAMEALNFEEFFVMELTYCDALFAMEYYEKHISVANNVIELSISIMCIYFKARTFIKNAFPKSTSTQSTQSSS